MGADNGTGENDRALDDRALWAQAAVIARMLPLFEHNVIGEILVFLKPATRFTRFARYRDRHGQPYRRGERHRCWTISHPRQGQPHPVVLLDNGLFGYVDPPDGIDSPEGQPGRLTYLSRKPLRGWDPVPIWIDDDPARDVLRSSLEGALYRYMHFRA